MRIFYVEREAKTRKTHLKYRCRSTLEIKSLIVEQKPDLNLDPRHRMFAWITGSSKSKVDSDGDERQRSQRGQTRDKDTKTCVAKVRSILQSRSRETNQRDEQWGAEDRGAT